MRVYAPGNSLVGDDNGRQLIETFQQRVEDWLHACFPEPERRETLERAHRLLEEALELAQANDCSQDEAMSLVGYVFNRPKGDPKLEVGGVLVTLAALCSASGIVMAEAGETELSRNWQRIEAIRSKQATKPRGSALPQ